MHLLTATPLPLCAIIWKILNTASNYKVTSTKTFILILILFSACIQTNRKSDFTYVVSSFRKPQNPKEPPPPPPPSYAPFNFIIDTVGDIYYYQLQLWKTDDSTEGVNDDLTPLFINLQPQHITKIPLTAIDAFIKENINHYDPTLRYVAIACQLDTVKSAGLEKLIGCFSVAKNYSNFYIRKTTWEENIVLEYKKKHVYYNANVIKWDSAEIRF